MPKESNQNAGEGSSIEHPAHRTPEVRPDQAFAAIVNPVKLVIWDLDETFWSGTLSEGGIREIDGHAALVRHLADRGIVSSICSKNDRAAVEGELERIGVRDLFVFAHIDWTPKGQAIAEMIAAMGLRAENVLFIDDNPMNLEEAVFFNPGLMCIDGRADLPDLEAHPHLAGKEDSGHSRLRQYRILEARQIDREGASLDNVDFLRRSEIRVEVINDVEAHMERVLELINRTNQLNYTKKRVRTEDEMETFRALLATSGVHAGVVRVTDRYGDYGIVGFFAARVKYNGTRVHHFCFSCRTLNMGVEQFVWERIGRPEIEVKGPVANPVDSFDTVDWIMEAESSDRVFGETHNRSLCLVGGCDLLQVSFYCGTERHEFVNKEQDGYLVRYDDPGFFLNPRRELRHSPVLKRFPTWTREDMSQLDSALAASDVILLSLYYAVPGDTFFTFGGKRWGGEFLLKIPPRTLRKIVKSDDALWFAKNFFHRPISMEQSLNLTRRSLDKAARLAHSDARIFVLSAATKAGKQAERTGEIRSGYNAVCAAFCASWPNAQLVDLDLLLDDGDFQDSDHYTRAGYYKIAKFVNDSVAEALPVPAAS